MFEKLLNSKLPSGWSNIILNNLCKFGTEIKLTSLKALRLRPAPEKKWFNC